MYLQPRACEAVLPDVRVVLEASLRQLFDHSLTFVGCKAHVYLVYFYWRQVPASIYTAEGIAVCDSPPSPLGAPGQVSLELSLNGHDFTASGECTPPMRRVQRTDAPCEPVAVLH